MEAELLYPGGIDGNLPRVAVFGISDSFGDFITCSVRQRQNSTGNQDGD
jgi:hypothetical protein